VIQFERLDFEGGDIIALVIEFDTFHGGPFRQAIPWNPIGAVDTLAQIVQSAGGVVHA
jgi:hypothetical protein